MDKTYIGIVKWCDIEKGYGFIKSTNMKKDIFFHIEQCIFEGLVLPKSGQKVEFQLYEDEKGMKAINIYPL